MEEWNQLDELLGCWNGRETRNVAPCTAVIFGASGDLTSRKLIPALYHLFLGGQLPNPFRIVGVARREKLDASWREELFSALLAKGRRVDRAAWSQFEQLAFYCRGDLTDPAAYQTLRGKLDGFGDPRLSENQIGRAHV